MQDKIEQITREIQKAAGMDSEGRIKGHHVLITVGEMMKSDPHSVWKKIPSGSYQIKVYDPVTRKDVIVRTKKDGSYDMKAILEAIKKIVEYKKAVEKERPAPTYDAELDKASNQELVNDIMGKRRFLRTFIGDHKNSTSYVVPSTTPGKVEVRIDFGRVSPEYAEKILDFVKNTEMEK